MLQLLFLLMGGQNPATPPCKARLELHQQEGMMTVTGHCRNLLPTAGRYRYELLTMREGAGGRSQNTQRGEFEVASQQEIALSQTRVNVSAQDSYQIRLRVLDMAGHAVAQDSASQNMTR
ncbi:curli-like amyloid fiber formation chaperone CsgH [Hymenobacter convexus]|uniref:curli-like amyloid fiber formation chaperone CsgH n=1 Tax=Hymenobacter sp. CA1UV-4 TaxID=3063782 RepID=UPI002712E653|nr:curli-like amyloid fiber formation chaperone CsgH [Hymenobacter sp. CA1UV-4]MDO7850711.1 curli-like amyloid fiber formation chaperone CsgH [Hymenobacter sp. CA1UV-4]